MNFESFCQDNHMTTESKKVPECFESDSILVNDIYYDTDKLSETHPGGSLFVELFGGRDATEAFHAYHRRPFPHASMEAYKHELPLHTRPERATITDDVLYMDLCKEVNQVCPINKSFAPLYYYVKAASLLCMAGILEYFIHSTGKYTMLNTSVLGFLFALIGLNIQHDANHGSISRYFWVNRVLGLTQNWIGGSAVDWMHQHVVQHHVHCNDVFCDPDIVGNDYLRLNPMMPVRFWNIFQAFYVGFLFSLFGFFYSMESLRHYYEMRNFTPYCSYIENHINIDRLVSAIFLSRWIIFPIFFSEYPVLQTFVQIFPLLDVGGYYLSFFFILSHNYHGVLQYDTDYGQKMGLLKRQVLTSSNVGGSLLCELNGGLNYQIEHHLFPRIHHSHYPKIAPIVKAFCEKHRIRYTHFPTIIENVWSCMNHLTHMSLCIYYENGREKEKED